LAATSAHESGVHVAHHQDGGRGFPIEHRLEATHHLRRLHGVRGRPHLQVDIGVGYPQGIEETLVHFLVVVLAGVDEPHRQRRDGAPHRPDDRCDLHEIRTRADNAKYRSARNR
jgi:hypothetical protein